MTNAQGDRGWAAVMVAAILMILVAAIATPAQTYSVVYAFKGGTDGSFPQGGLVADASGNFYGTTAFGGINGEGTVFRVDTSGNETILYNFTGGDDGGLPANGVILDSAGNLYGTTAGGGSFGGGVIFRLDPVGNQTVLYSFTGGSDGGSPECALLRDGAGNLYGTTVAGGDRGFGVVFKLSSGGKLTTLHSFAGFPTDGQSPFPGLVHDAAGNLYGTTQFGGTASVGTVFKIDSTGTETVLHSFANSDGGFPFLAPLLLDSSGNLYGTTSQGGLRSGVAFKLDAAGNETVLHSFLGKADGGHPYAALVRDSSGTLYGTTYAGGNLSDCSGMGCGVVFKLSPTGQETLLYTFTGGSDGGGSYSSLLPYKGALYGMTSVGGDIAPSCGNGTSGCGVVFKLTLP